ncbi:Nuclear pore complex protein [Hordeum vulgare]|nr:Nuclear pore complex protein [Hordeum vulgare]
MWVKHGCCLVKINVDATFHEDNLSGACGAIVRGDHGDFVASANWFLPHVRDAESAQLHAMRNGLYLATNIGYSSVEIESDCMAMMEAMQSMDDYLGADLAMVLECKDVDYEVKVAQIDADIRILKLQEEIVQHDPEYAQGKHTSKLLRPSELIEMCMKRGRELSLKAFEVFAWTGSSFRSSNKGLLEACWANATDQDDWVELSQASVSKGWSDEDAVVFDDPFEEVLPVRKEDVHARGLEAKCFSVEEVLMQHDTFLDAGKLMMTAVVMGKELSYEIFWIPNDQIFSWGRDSRLPRLPRNTE